MNVLVIGYGSIGKRHAGVLSRLKHKVSVLTQYPDEEGYDFYSSFEKLPTDYDAQYVVIANNSSDHFKTYQSSRQRFKSSKILVEKPVSINSADWSSIKDESVYVGYNLRFHPLISELKILLDKERAISANFYVGQNLADWRPEKDYRKSYSAKRSLGGGVLFDLSHELDLVNYLFGRCEGLFGSVSKLSDLEIDCDDSFMGVLEHTNCSKVSMEMNIIDRSAKRTIIIQTESSSIKLDLIAGRIEVNGKNRDKPIERNQSYQSMHESILIDQGVCCSLSEGIEVLKVIESIELSNQSQQWVKRDE
jgi:predicted dehydrogenase